MNLNKIITGLTIAAMTLAVVSTTADSHSKAVADDPIVASFERAFNHESAPAAAVTREAIDSDELYQLVNLPLRAPQDQQRGEL